MWPYRNPNPSQNQPQNPDPFQKPPAPYNPTSYPPGFLPPRSQHTLSFPTPSHPGFGQYSSNPFNPPALPSPIKRSAPHLQPSSAFYIAGTYRDHTSTHATPADPEKLRAATPQPHLAFRPAFGVSGFTPAAPHDLAFKPLEFTQADSQPQSWGIRNRPFGYQPRPMFPPTIFHSSSRFNPANVKEGEKKKKKKVLKPSERVRMELDGIAERDEKMEGMLGAGAGQKRKRELTPSEKVRKRLEGLGPRDRTPPELH